MLARAHEAFRHLILYLEQSFQTCLALEVSKNYPQKFKLQSVCKIFLCIHRNLMLPSVLVMYTKCSYSALMQAK